MVHTLLSVVAGVLLVIPAIGYTSQKLSPNESTLLYGEEGLRVVLPDGTTKSVVAGAPVYQARFLLPHEIIAATDIGTIHADIEKDTYIFLVDGPACHKLVKFDEMLHVVCNINVYNIQHLDPHGHGVPISEALLERIYTDTSGKTVAEYSDGSIYVLQPVQ